MLTTDKPVLCVCMYVEREDGKPAQRGWGAHLLMIMGLLGDRPLKVYDSSTLSLIIYICVHVFGLVHMHAVPTVSRGMGSP